MDDKSKPDPHHLWSSRSVFPWKILLHGPCSQNQARLRHKLTAMGAKLFVTDHFDQALPVINGNKLDGVVLDWGAPDSERLARRVRVSRSNSRTLVAILGTEPERHHLNGQWFCNMGWFRTASEVGRFFQLRLNHLLNERLLYHRVEQPGLAICLWSRSSASGVVLNLSTSGMLFMAQNTSPPETNVSCLITISDPWATLTMKGLVIRRTRRNAGPGEDGQPVELLGVKFESVNQRHARRLRQFIKQSWAKEYDRWLVGGHGASLTRALHA
ncbi:MAG: hypothetical protein A2289_03270 [Deltaproteobacteria bacterium RIFOXYA12_FULL_58_15]|nr:MAG: hypothetical protein A2289_03270 [Deltaproteobacteria bacterium RIFOXYA12_FULL_58_15]OGR14072.1 MAG: hypothetical protein A2341_19245 [Deltaproteobacteria bacterium RIFOXYB12_FULL_58_9]